MPSARAFYSMETRFKTVGIGFSLFKIAFKARFHEHKVFSVWNGLCFDF